MINFTILMIALLQKFELRLTDFNNIAHEVFRKDIIDVALVSLLLTVDIFHTFF